MDESKQGGTGHPSAVVKVKRPGERRSLSRSATRALDVLELFGVVRRPLRAIEIAKALELHPSSMDQLLKTMVESGHLTFDALPKTYLPSPRLVQFSGWMLASYGGDERFRSLMCRLNAASGEVVTLTTPNDLFMQVLDVVGIEPTAESAERGLRVSIFGSTTGAAYLSTLPKSELHRLITRARIRNEDAPAILAHIACVREAGVADGPSADGRYWSVAMPLPVGSSLAPLILGLAGPTERVTTNLGQMQLVLRRSVEQWRLHRGVLELSPERSL